jgi:hypothetical protein
LGSSSILEPCNICKFVGLTLSTMLRISDVSLLLDITLYESKQVSLTQLRLTFWRNLLDQITKGFGLLRHFISLNEIIITDYKTVLVNKKSNLEHKFRKDIKEAPISKLAKKIFSFSKTEYAKTKTKSISRRLKIIVRLNLLSQK